MKKRNKSNKKDEFLKEYDLSKLKAKGRGRYTTRCKDGTNLELLSPDLADESVNEALRALAKIARNQARH